MSRFTLETTTPLILDCQPPLNAMYVLSPYVWRVGDQYELLLRAVTKADDPKQKIARVYHGHSADGVRFVMDREPVLAPTIDAGADDADGCEDPSLARQGDQYQIFYTGWNQGSETGRLLRAAGSHITQLAKQGRVLPEDTRYRNTKEAEIVPCQSADWRLFFEYAADERSKIGLATAASLDGPWQFVPDPFAARPNNFDAWHLSTGPVINATSDEPMMFYNGATPDAHWRIGWVSFDAAFSAITGRCAEPLIVPPPPKADATDIAFAASAITHGATVWLYYSVSDDCPTRAILHLHAK